MMFRGVPKCVCPDLCPQRMAPVCGSDGLTYENDCAMRRASCKSEKTITVANRGPCDGKTSAKPDLILYFGLKPVVHPAGFFSGGFSGNSQGQKTRNHLTQQASQLTALSPSSFIKVPTARTISFIENETKEIWIGLEIMIDFTVSVVIN